MVHYYNQPTFASDVLTFVDGSLRGVQVRNVRVGTDPGDGNQQLRTLNILHSVLVRAVKQAASAERSRRGLPPLAGPALLHYTKGLMHVFNVNTNTGHVAEFEQNQVVRADAITIGMLTGITNKIIISGQDVVLTDLVWTFYFDETSWIEGGAPSQVKPPRWIPNRNFSPTWYGHEVNCAAFALVFAMSTRAQRRSIPGLQYRAQQLAAQLHWRNPTTAAFEIGAFVQQYRHYKVIVVIPLLQYLNDFTFTGSAYDGSVSNLIFLCWDPAQNHYGLVESASKTLARFHGDSRIRFCANCSTRHLLEKACRCDDIEPPQPRKKPAVVCVSCGKRDCDAGCPKQCFVCRVIKDNNHRCIVYEPPKAPRVFWKLGDAEVSDVYSSDHTSQAVTARDAPYKLYVYDIEAAIANANEEHCIDFARTDEGAFILDDDGKATVFESSPSKHIPVMVIYRNVFDPDSEVVLTGPNCLQEFVVKMITTNFGRNICIAHNGSGYDTRHIAEVAARLVDAVHIQVVPRGVKFMQLKLGRHTVFGDSLLQLPGSLAALAKGFFGGDVVVKGYFPHLFNTAANHGYRGPIPSKRYFDMAFSAKTADSLAEFNKWYDERTLEVWDFDEELLKYCRNDVLILSMLVKEYHDICTSKYEVSPWFSMTAPSYVHKAVVRQLSVNLELPDVTSREEYSEAVREAAWNTHWGVNTPNEYWFARGALRGGRTDVRKLHYLVSPQDWARGVRISYVDIVSMYPYCQIAFQYPVGLPEIFVYTPDLYPCYMHRNPKDGSNYLPSVCGCSLLEKKTRGKGVDKRLNIFESYDCVPSVDQILADDSFFGYVCASLTPPRNIFHPVLVVWDDDAGKCIGSLRPIDHGRLTTPEFKKALRCGYRLDALHRLDRYRAAPGLWNDFIKPLYVDKMASSEACPDQATQDTLVQAYSAEPFCMGDAVRESFPRWGLLPAKRQVVKIMLNCGWGKHCEQPNKDEVKFLGDESEEGHLNAHNFIADLATGVQRVKDISLVGDKTMVRYGNTGVAEPSFHRGYIPAGAFVPAYGRLMLHEQLEKLGDRVLYHDTDSIMYVDDPDLYSVPQSDIWGGWSEEKFGPKNGGIREFVALGPKSYGIRGNNGVSQIKIKGLSLKLAHEPLINFGVMKSMVLAYRDSGLTPAVGIPQFNFAYKPGKGISTVHMLKNLVFQPTQLKGVLHGLTLYPYGHEKDETVY